MTKTDWIATIVIKNDTIIDWYEYPEYLRPCKMDEGGWYPITKRWGTKEDYWGFCNNEGNEVRVLVKD